MPRESGTQISLDDFLCEFLTLHEVATLLRVSIRSVWYHVRSGRLPPPVYIGPRQPRWRRSQIFDWLEANNAQVQQK